MMESTTFLWTEFVAMLVLPVTRHQGLKPVHFQLSVSHEVFLDFYYSVLNLLILLHNPLKFLLKCLLVHLLTTFTSLEFLQLQLFSLLIHNLEFGLNILIPFLQIRQRLPVLRFNAIFLCFRQFDVLQTVILLLVMWRALSRYAAEISFLLLQISF